MSTGNAYIEIRRSMFEFIYQKKLTANLETLALLKRKEER